jgi:excisionase family DNA binding protein
MVEDELLTTKEVASYLKVGEETVRRLIRRGQLRAVKFTKSYRVRKKDLNVTDIVAIGQAGHQLPSAAGNAEREGTLQSLETVYRECLTENWDGYGAKPVSPATLEAARRFCEKLPGSFPEPEVAADPDGEICLDWDKSPDQAFSVSVGSIGRLTYAGLFGPNKVNGAEHFEAEVPEAIIQNLKRLFANVV